MTCFHPVPSYCVQLSRIGACMHAYPTHPPVVTRYCVMNGAYGGRWGQGGVGMLHSAIYVHVYMASEGSDLIMMSLLRFRIIVFLTPS